MIKNNLEKNKNKIISFGGGQGAHPYQFLKMSKFLKHFLGGWAGCPPLPNFQKITKSLNTFQRGGQGAHPYLIFKKSQIFVAHFRGVGRVPTPTNFSKCHKFFNHISGGWAGCPPLSNQLTISFGETS